ncbi:hypothetical protein Tco_0417136, partial [Tanacetum coccineum]
DEEEEDDENKEDENDPDKVCSPSALGNDLGYRSLDSRFVVKLSLANLQLQMKYSPLRIEKKMLVIEQPIPPAPAVDFEANVLAKWNAVYDAHNDAVEYHVIMLGKYGHPERHRQF